LVLDVANYRIPTWIYKSNLFGRDVNKIEANQERALIANYQKLDFKAK